MRGQGNRRGREGRVAQNTTQKQFEKCTHRGQLIQEILVTLVLHADVRFQG